MDRREFLKLSAAAVAGVGAAPLLAEPAQATANCLWGAYASTQGKQTGRSAVLGLEKKIGRKLAITRHYMNWSDSLPSDFVKWSAQGGRTPYVAWHTFLKGGGAVSWRSIANGAHDARIRSEAQGMKQWGHHCFFCFHHEPEDDKGIGTPADYKAAWARVRRIFGSVGANNLTWVVALQGSTFAGSKGGPSIWMPGAYDLVGVDAYNRFPCLKNRADHPWSSFASIMAPAYKYAIAVGKPLFVGEYGTVEQDACGYSGSGHAKANWLLDAGLAVRSWPRLKAVVYSHTLAKYDGYPEAFWVDTSSSSLSAFRQVGLGSYFR